MLSSINESVSLYTGYWRALRHPETESVHKKETILTHSLIAPVQEGPQAWEGLLVHVQSL